MIRGGRSARLKQDEIIEEKRQYADNDKVDSNMNFKSLWMEWLLVQCVCDRARRELMEAVYLYLEGEDRLSVRNNIEKKD